MEILVRFKNKKEYLIFLIPPFQITIIILDNYKVDY